MTPLLVLFACADVWLAAYCTAATLARRRTTYTARAIAEDHAVEAFLAAIRSTTSSRQRASV